MENIEKIDVKKMKEDIKAMVEQQKFYVDQRKTVNRKGEYKMSPSEAQWKHHANRQALRLMYAAYGLARGKSLVQIEPNSKWEKIYEDSTYDECHPLRKHQQQIDKILDKYKIMVQIEAQE